MSSRVFLGILMFFLLSFCGTRKAKDDTITLFCAASLTPVLEQIKMDWEKDHPEKIIINSASSGTLARQIEYGAQADIFLSANHDWMMYVLNATANSNTPMTIARNRLALIAGKDINMDSADFQSRIQMLLVGQDKFSLGDHGHVPLGKYSEQTLNFYGIFESIKARAILAKDARSALRLVELGEATFGLVYLTDAIASEQVKIIAVAQEASHMPIAYEAVLINDSHLSAKQFLDYLGSDQAKNLWIRNGFNQ